MEDRDTFLNIRHQCKCHYLQALCHLADTDLDPVMCSLLHNISNGYVTINPSNRSVGSIATYGCHNNFSLNGNEMRTCQRYGSWTGSEPLCGKHKAKENYIAICS